MALSRLPTSVLLVLLSLVHGTAALEVMISRLQGPVVVSRAAFVRTAAAAAIALPTAAAIALPTAANAASSVDAAAAADTLALLKQARTQLEPCADYIADGQWDTVRTTVKTAPLQNVKNLVTTYIKQLGTDEAEDLVLPREDFVQALQLLDMNVYNNVFVGEQNGQGKRGAGVAVDRDTPRGYLRDAKKALDEIIAFQ